MFGWSPVRKMLRLLFLSSWGWLLLGITPVKAQYSAASTTRFFEAIRPLFLFEHTSSFNQDLLAAARDLEEGKLREVKESESRRLFAQSQFFKVGEKEVYYYAFNKSYGNYHQIVLCSKGTYSPFMVLMNFSRYGKLMGEMTLAGNFVDGGEAYVWNSQLENQATLSFNYNSYRKKGDKFYCDSTVSTYAIRKEGELELLGEELYTVLTRGIGGSQLEITNVKHKQSHVFAPSGLQLRASLQRRAKRLAIIPYGAKLVVKKVSEQPFQSDWVKGNWAYVKYDTLEGYVFDGYLSTFPAPDTSRFENCESDYPSLLRDYVSLNFQPISPRDTNQVDPQSGESFDLQTEQYFTDSLKLTTHQFNTGSSTEFIIPNSHIEDIYVLLHALLQTCQDARELQDSLVFVKNRKGRIYKIYDRSGFVILQTYEGRSTKLVMNSTSP